MGSSLDRLVQIVHGGVELLVTRIGAGAQQQEIGMRLIGLERQGLGRVVGSLLEVAERKIGVGAVV